MSRLLKVPDGLFGCRAKYAVYADVERPRVEGICSPFTASPFRSHAEGRKFSYGGSSWILGGPSPG